MRNMIRLVTLAAVLMLGAEALSGQRAPRPAGPAAITRSREFRREGTIVRARSMNPRRRHAIRRATRQQRAAVRTERRMLARGVRAGQLTRPQARSELRRWRQARRHTIVRPNAQVR